MTERVTGEDVYVQDAHENVVVEQAEDVVIEGHAVSGSLTIENAQDVIIKTTATVDVEQSEDVRVEGNADVSVHNAETVDEEDGLF